jgi:branched-chain amino acid transport system ATP-binding protein
MPEPLLAVDRLSTGYGDVQVLWGVSLVVGRGEMVTVLGPNGAGKSTLLRALVGLNRPWGRAGRTAVTFAGRSLDGLEPEEIVRLGLVLAPEGARVFPEMTCLDNLKLGAYALADQGQVPRLLEEVLDLFPALRERLGRRAKTLSGGERQMLAIGRSLMSQPRCLLLDEPSLGLHPLMTSRLFGLIERINRQGVTILLVEQKVTFALRLSHRGYVLENGRVVRSGTGPELLGDERVKRAYLAR